MMAENPTKNPLLGPIQESFAVKRRKKDGFIPRNWLLIVLCILDMIAESDSILAEDDVYTYDYTLKKSRAKAIPTLLAKYSLPLNLGMGKEGVTVRGAPGLRMFRAMKGGAVIMERPIAERRLLVREAVELVREELMRVLGQKPVELLPHEFEQSGAFVAALLKAVENRSNGRVEQALVGAKLQLRFPNIPIPNNPGFAGDRQTGRDSDFAAENIRVIVSVSPKAQHFEAATSLADQGRQVFLVVSKRAFPAAGKRIERAGYQGRVLVASVEYYVASNMSEISTERRHSAREMCLLLANEYNRRIADDNDASLRVVLPE